jgi:hypothetical protein
MCIPNSNNSGSPSTRAARVSCGSQVACATFAASCSSRTTIAGSRSSSARTAWNSCYTCTAYSASTARCPCRSAVAGSRSPGARASGHSRCTKSSLATDPTFMPLGFVRR